MTQRMKFSVTSPDWINMERGNLSVMRMKADKEFWFSPPGFIRSLRSSGKLKL
jgi:hypothetical protein